MVNAYRKNKSRPGNVLEAEEEHRRIQLLRVQESKQSAQTSLVQVNIYGPLVRVQKYTGETVFIISKDDYSKLPHQRALGKYTPDLKSFGGTSF